MIKKEIINGINLNESPKSQCGLCGSATKKLTKTNCCDNWICDDSDSYVLFSYARNSCYRNHDRYTLCAYHFREEHKGKWQECKKCKDSMELPDYVENGTNEYNFVVLENPEKFEITCVHCGFIANSQDKFAYRTSKGHYCAKAKCQEAALNFGNQTSHEYNKIGRNDPCNCGSGKKYKKCCMSEMLNAEKEELYLQQEDVNDDFMVSTEADELSKIILDLSSDWLNAATTWDDKADAILIAAVAWNAAQMSSRKREKFINESLTRWEKDNYPIPSEKIKDYITDIIAKKEKLYPDFNRIILDCEFYESDHERGFDLSVVLMAEEEG